MSFCIGVGSILDSWYSCKLVCLLLTFMSFQYFWVLEEAFHCLNIGMLSTSSNYFGLKGIPSAKCIHFFVGCCLLQRENPM